MNSGLLGVEYPSKFKKSNEKSGMKEKSLAVFFGLVVGAVNGLFGAGGGMLVVPILSYLYGLSAKKSHATAIMIILPLCMVSAVVYAIKGSYDYSIFPATIVGVVAGGIAGALLLKKANNVALRYVFYFLMLLAGLKMIF